MNKMLAIISAVGLVVGCSKQEAVKSPAVQAINPVRTVARPTPPPRRIMGAFGWQLGQIIPSSYSVAQGDDGMLSLHDALTNFPPFEGFSIIALDDRRVCAIAASAYGAPSEQEDIVLSALTNKYGPAKLQFDKDDNTQTAKWTIDDGYAEISLNYSIKSGYLTLYYFDHELEKIQEEKRQRINAAKMHKISTNL